jgi:hypothetical protein
LRELDYECFYGASSHQEVSGLKYELSVHTDTQPLADPSPETPQFDLQDLVERAAKRFEIIV